MKAWDGERIRKSGEDLPPSAWSISRASKSRIAFMGVAKISLAQSYIDYGGPTMNKYFLVLVNAHSKWVGIFLTSRPTASESIKNLRHCFSFFWFTYFSGV